jgi:hypothetical protein
VAQRLHAQEALGAQRVLACYNALDSVAGNSWRDTVASAPAASAAHAHWSAATSALRGVLDAYFADEDGEGGGSGGGGGDATKATTTSEAGPAETWVEPAAPGLRFERLSPSVLHELRAAARRVRGDMELWFADRAGRFAHAAAGSFTEMAAWAWDAAASVAVVPSAAAVVDAHAAARRRLAEGACSARAVTRVLQGLGSPLFPASEWRARAHWAAFGRCRFADVLAVVAADRVAATPAGSPHTS